VSTPSAQRDQPEELSETIERAVLAHPSVARLDGGQFGSVASYLAGRRVIGVRTEAYGDPVELAVVLWLGRPIPDVVTELRALVRSVAGGVPVDITVSDLQLEEDAAEQGSARQGSAPAGRTRVQ
jgi:hypothetical protein